MQGFPRNGSPPAKGLLRLTWPQIEVIDAKVSSLCALTETGEVQAELVVTIKNGRVEFVKMLTSERLRPHRS